MKKATLVKLASVYLATVGMAFVVPAETLTFDTLSDGTAVPNGYGGLDWNNIQVIGGADLPGSGYAVGNVSPPNEAFNPYGAPAGFSAVSGTFDLTSGYFTAAWRDDMNMEVQGWDGATLVYDNNYTLNWDAQSFITFNYEDITAVDIITSGGFDVDPNYGQGTHIAMDNLVIDGISSSAPDGGMTGLMLGGACAGLGMLRRKLNK